ncbi:LysR family transcriptional regulator [Paracoccus laeviglucosivorans]|uniref:DNA-binding transcriptional regulator, LysR family n=1 Tax=Paracoccus laeviglucosivorans TaxID=1197861 RepID=A0A521ESZ2_9RHOB|nr:LysR family transcriptional regulator [Paracoccus laeviglucosivorans]SMO87035.1 DNA-binding transcriptional regulator, LysR family [Paracoccus laeviglucosivorans]
MELRHIRYFLAVAEERNFTRAAHLLGIGQPPLSQQIRDLEREIGAQLFHRVPHGAELTGAGLVFRDKVSALPGLVAAAADAARRAARGELGELRLGITGTAALHPIVPRLIREFRRERPGVALHLSEANSVNLREALSAGRLDVAILRPNATDPSEIVTHHLASEPLVAAISATSDPAPSDAAISLADIAALPLILTPRAIGMSLHDAALDACRRAGFEPKLGQLAPQIASILSLISADLGFSLVPASMQKLLLEGVVYKALTGQQDRVSIAVAVRRGALEAPLAAFVAKARTLREDADV